MLIVGFTRGIPDCHEGRNDFRYNRLLSGIITFRSQQVCVCIRHAVPSRILSNSFITGSSSQATIHNADYGSDSRADWTEQADCGFGFTSLATALQICSGRPPAPFTVVLWAYPLNKWYKFITPFFGIVLVLEVIFMTIAVAIGYC